MILKVSPQDGLFDEPIHIVVAGLAAQQQVAISAAMQDDSEAPWTSRALLVADATGVIDLANSPAISGSYTGLDPLGLLWSMAPAQKGALLRRFAKSSDKPLELYISVEIAGTEIARRAIVRRCLAPGVRRVDEREQGLVGTFYAPESKEPQPAVILLGGSSGAVEEARAALLASHGLATFALGYFAREGLPADLSQIPLEYFYRALNWLQGRSEVASERIAIMGASKGAEAALLLGATLPEVAAVIAYAPSAVVFQGLSRQQGETRVSSWSRNGQDVPFVPYAAAPEIDQAAAKGEPLAFAQMYSHSVENSAAAQQATIPVEQINGPIMLISGGDDQMWPSARFSDMITSRLKRCNFTYPVTHLNYPQAGHLIGLPNIPTTVVNSAQRPGSLVFAYGGAPQGNAIASADSWRQVLAFLQRYLKPTP